jgi:hypothetical protein
MLPTQEVEIVNSVVKTTAAVATTPGVAAHVDAINLLLPKLKQITDDLEGEIGRHILAIKVAEPNAWEMIVKAQCGLSRSRAFELMRIAQGITSAEQTRRETNARQIKYRQKKAVRDVTDKNELAAVRTQLDEAEEQHERLVMRLEAEIARLQDGRHLRFERDQLRDALAKIVELLGEVRGLVAHPAQHHSNIRMKLNAMEAVAKSALRPADTPVKHAA